MLHSTSTALLKNSSDWHFHSLEFGEMKIEVNGYTAQALEIPRMEDSENTDLRNRGAITAVSTGVEITITITFEFVLNSVQTDIK